MKQKASHAKADEDIGIDLEEWSADTSLDDLCMDADPNPTVECFVGACQGIIQQGINQMIRSSDDARLKLFKANSALMELKASLSHAQEVRAKCLIAARNMETVRVRAHTLQQKQVAFHHIEREFEEKRHLYRRITKNFSTDSLRMAGIKAPELQSLAKQLCEYREGIPSYICRLIMTLTKNKSLLKEEMKEMKETKAPKDSKMKVKREPSRRKKQ